MDPLVTIICLCYNHERFLLEALDSVLSQTYRKVQIIIVDDASSDRSCELLQQWHKENIATELILNASNIGNCRSFNLALKKARGKYVIDFATDDVMLPNRVEEQVKFFETLNQSYGVVYSDCECIDEDSYLIESGAKKEFPSGDIYKELVESYFISPPTMMIKKEVLEYLGGYDENLAYEDFDFWVRSSRRYKYGYQGIVTTKVRKTSGSLSQKFYGEESGKMLESTLKVCEKAFLLNKSKEERKALGKRISYELRQSMFTSNFDLANSFFELQVLNRTVSLKDRLVKFFASMGWNMNFLNRTAKAKG